MRNRFSLFLLAGILLLVSCSVEKRHYRRGFYISSRSPKHLPSVSVSEKNIQDSTANLVSANDQAATQKSTEANESLVSEKEKPFSTNQPAVLPHYFCDADAELQKPREAFSLKAKKHKLSVNTDITVYALIFFLLCAWLFRRFGASLLLQFPSDAGLFFCFILVVSFAVTLPLQLIFLGFGLALALNNPDNFSVGLTVVYTLIGLLLAALFVLELILIWNLLSPFAFIKTVHLILLGLWILVMILGMTTLRKRELMEEGGLYFGKKNKL